MRYFLYLSYNGTRFSGWQRQPEALSVQEQVETVLETILRRPVEIVGCGRTDAGVHASFYVAHVDFDGDFPAAFLQRANKLIGPDVYLQKLEPVDPEKHARFDAYLRSYAYHITFVKNPFGRETEWFYPYSKENLNFEAIQEAAALLLQFEAFEPFCKTQSDATTMRCQLARSEWLFEGDKAIFYITSNRFLRGMVRLIVGMCLLVGGDQLTLEEVRRSLETQTPLRKNYSVPPTGLFLTEVKYP